MFRVRETLLLDVPAGAESDFFDDISVILFSAYFFDPISFDGDVVGLVYRGENTPIKLNDADSGDRSYAVFDNNRTQLLKQKNIDQIVDSLKDLK